jgi:hypothetical protein
VGAPDNIAEAPANALATRVERSAPSLGGSALTLTFLRSALTAALSDIKGLGGNLIFFTSLQTWRKANCSLDQREELLEQTL